MSADLEWLDEAQSHRSPPYISSNTLRRRAGHEDRFIQFDFRGAGGRRVIARSQ